MVKATDKTQKCKNAGQRRRGLKKNTSETGCNMKHKDDLAGSEGKIKTKDMA